MKTIHALGLMVILASAGCTMAIGLSRSDAIPGTPSGALPSAQSGIKESETMLAQMTSTQGQATAAPVTTLSSPATIALAKHLKRMGAKMYGAYWCPHCHEQLQLFGQEAVTQLLYVECAEDGKNARPDLCRAAKIEGYPTWKIKGKTYEGTQPLTELANASGYKGSRSF